MKWMRNNINELGALACLSVFFYGVAQLIQELGGFIGFWWTPLFGASVFFAGVLFAWMVFAILFKDLNRFVDMGLFDEAFEELHPYGQVFLVVSVFLVLIYFFIQCCALSL